MYAEESTTGINYMDLSRREAIMIRDSLIYTSLHRALDSEERKILKAIIDITSRVCEKTNSARKA